MPHWGKVVGTVSGLATGAPLLAFVGLVLGHQFDRGFARARRARVEEPGKERLPSAFVDALFPAAGRVAKANGRVSEDEIRATRALMHRLGLGPAAVREAIDLFERGKQPGYPLTDLLRKLRRETVHRRALRPLFVRLLLEVALTKTVLDRRERDVIWGICTELEISRVELAQLEALLRARKKFLGDAPAAADRQRLHAAYATLGLAAGSTNADIKQAYRRLMNRHHPDKLGGVSDASSLQAAEKRTREIINAYEFLKARRAIR